jgi:hypothetical protein
MADDETTNEPAPEPPPAPPPEPPPVDQQLLDDAFAGVDEVELK